MKKELLFTNARLVFPDFFTEGSLRVTDGRILVVSPERRPAAQGARVVDCRGDYLGPGFVDLHNHGACQVDFIDGEVEGIAAALRYHQAQGATSVLASLITHLPATMSRTIRRHVQAEKKGALPKNFAGLHLEGPYLNPEKKGMHRIDWMHDPDPREYQGWVREGKGWVRMVTAAPERPGALEMYAWLHAQGVVGNIGHTTVGWERAWQAAAAGAAHFIHVNNACEWPFREKNAAGWLQTQTRGIASFLNTDLFSGEVIADGYHVTPEIIRLIARCKGPDRLALVSDASPLTGLKPGRYVVATFQVDLRREGICLLADGSALASSVCPVVQMVRNLCQWGFPLVQAWRMASLTPARIVGFSDRGRLQAGCRADLVRLDAKLAIRGVWQSGQVIN